MFLRIFFSIISMLCGISAFIAFYILKNNQAATWGIATGSFSALSVNIHRLKYQNRIADYYTSINLHNQSQFGITGFAFGVAGFIYNMIIFIDLKVPILPVEGSNFISAVWCVLTAKSGFLLFFYARQYADFVASVPQRQPLLTQDQPQEP